VSFVVDLIFFVFLIFRTSWVLGNRTYFLTTGIRAIFLVRVRAMAGEEGKIGIEKFNSTDFGYWKVHFEDILYGKDLHPPLLGEQPDDMYDNE